MASAIQHISQAMLEEDPEKAAEHVAKAEEALAKFKDSFVALDGEAPKLNTDRLVP